MPYFAITHNDAHLACAGEEHIRVLSAHVIVTEAGGASLGVHGMGDSRDGPSNHLTWVSKLLPPGDHVEIAYVLDGQPTPPSALPDTPAPTFEPSGAAADIEAELNRLTEELKSLRAPGGPDRSAAWIGPGLRAPRPRLLRVSVNGGEPINAALGEEEQLQAVVNLTPGRCVLEVDALTVLESGYTKGKRWLQKDLSPGDRVQIRYAT